MDVKRCDYIVWVLATVFLFAGCQQPSTAVSTPEPSECAPTEVEIVWPQLLDIEPDQVLPGDEVKIIASGGYEIECGDFYNESHRLFEIYLNQDQVGMLSCMVNHCEVILQVPEDIKPGTHIISTEGGSQIEFEVGVLEVLEWDEEFPESAKGYELYSWLEVDEWHFTLISGTNRNKTVEELLSPENVLTQDGWVKITVSSAQALKLVLDNLPGSEEIFWLDGARVEGTGEDIPFGFPSEEILQEIRQYSDLLKLELHIVR